MWAYRFNVIAIVLCPSVSDRPLQHLSDETLRLLVENARQLKEGSGVVINGDGQVVSE